MSAWRRPFIVRLAALLGCILIATAAAAQLRSTNSLGGNFFQLSPQSSPTKYKVSGTVVNSVTGMPIGRALVQAPGVAAMLTDPSGSFEFEALGGSVLSLMVRKPGYFSEQEVARGFVSARASIVQIGPNLEPLTLKLIPEAFVVGRVTGADGEPLESAQVRLYTSVITNGQKRWQQAGGTSTDEDGTYRIGNLRPGSYLVSVGAPRFALADVASQNQKQQAMGYPLEWFYPGVPERSAAGTINVAPGQETQADFTLRKQPVFRISGTVVRPQGVMGAGIQLISPSGDSVGAFAQVMPNGNFLIRQVPAGSYILQSNAGDQQGHQYSARMQVNVAADVSGVVLALDTPPSVPVVIRTQYSKPHPENSPPQFCTNGKCSSTPPTGYRPPPPVQVQLRALDPPYWSAYSQPQPPDFTTFAVENVYPGRYAVEFPSSFQSYVKSATSGNSDLLREPLVVPPGARAQPISIDLADDTGTLILSPNGTVPENGAQVLAFLDGAPTQPPRITYLQPPRAGGGSMFGGSAGRIGGAVFSAPGDANGNTRIGGLAPGDYTVLAFDRIDGLEYANPEVMKNYLPRAAHATVYGNRESTISIDVIHFGE